MEDYNNDDIIKSLFSTFNRLKEDVIKDYINGKINKEQYIKEMRNYDGSRN